MSAMFFKDLSKKEKRHLRENGCCSLSGFSRVAAEQKKMRESGKSEPCFECKFIARKLGLEV